MLLVMNPQHHLLSLRIQGWIVLGLLVIESALGSKSEPLLILHIILSVLLLIGSVAFYVQAKRHQSVAWKIPSLVGIFGIFIAIIAGSLFAYTDASTYLSVMEVGAVLSLCSYGWGLWAARNEGNKMSVIVQAT